MSHSATVSSAAVSLPGDASAAAWASSSRTARFSSNEGSNGPARSAWLMQNASSAESTARA